MSLCVAQASPESRYVQNNNGWPGSKIKKHATLRKVYKEQLCEKKIGRNSVVTEHKKGLFFYAYNIKDYCSLSRYSGNAYWWCVVMSLYRVYEYIIIRGVFFFRYTYERQKLFVTKHTYPRRWLFVYRAHIHYEYYDVIILCTRIFFLSEISMTLFVIKDGRLLFRR